MSHHLVFINYVHMVIHVTTFGFQPFKLYVSAILSFTFEHGESFFGSTFLKVAKVILLEAYLFTLYLIEFSCSTMRAGVNLDELHTKQLQKFSS